MEARNRRRQEQLAQQQRQRDGRGRQQQRHLHRLTPASEVGGAAITMPPSSSAAAAPAALQQQRTPLMTIDMNKENVAPSDAMSTLTSGSTAPTLVSPTSNNGNVPTPDSGQQQQRQASSSRASSRPQASNRPQALASTTPPAAAAPAASTVPLVSPDAGGHRTNTYRPTSRSTTNRSSRSSSRHASASATAAQNQQQRNRAILAVSPDMADLLSTEYSEDDDEDDDDDSDDDVSSTSSDSMLSTALSVAGFDIDHSAKHQIEELKLRLAETATQLTTAEDELRQKMELEGSLRFAVDVLRKRLSIRKVSHVQQQHDAMAAITDDEKQELETVQDMLSDLGLKGPPSQQAARIAREMEDSELRTEGLRSRLVKSEQSRKSAELKLKETNAAVAELKAEIEVVRSKLSMTEKKAEKEKAKLERRCDMLESSKQSLKEELERFKTQLELVAEIKPSEKEVGGDGGNGTNDEDDEDGAANNEQTPQKAPRYRATSLRQTPSVEEREALEARAKAKVLLSLRRDADVTYQGAVEDLEAMISQVYARELKAEVDAVTGKTIGGEAGGQKAAEATKKLGNTPTKSIDEVGQDFKLLLSTRDRMLQLHEKIKKQCDSIVAMEGVADGSVGGWDVSEVHPVRPGAC